MKKLLLLLAVAFSATVVTSAQKFGHFNSSSFIDGMPAVKEVEKTLDAEQSRIESTVATLNEDFQKMYQEYQQKGPQMTEADQMQKEQELQEAYQKIQQYVQVSRQELVQKQRELMAPIMQKLMTAIQEVGVENNFLYIFEEKGGLTPYVSTTKSTDITPLVKKKLGM